MDEKSTSEAGIRSYWDFQTGILPTGTRGYLPPYATALVHCGLGQRDLAFDWLERAYKARDVHLALLPVDPKLDHLRSDVRFPKLVKRCGFDCVDIPRPLKSAKPDSGM